ncbi:hypothetical protein VB264_02115 [Arcicella aquatica]|uniref:DUF4249 family protein n=1 Tax=Arcicella aquatica TaxID=217141 RepID=A0ABU5QI88_9BACT|nr:DUF4249 family protein [Arcicella aquatica]MEA5256559.1 hypothetical protein [Arcicella aquatica]
MKSYIKFISSKNNLLAIIIFASLLGIVACDKDSNFIEGGARPVVEAYLVAGKPISLSVKKEIAYNEDTSNTEAPINGLNIKISDGTNTYSLTSNGAGVYKSDSTVKLKVGVTYNLSFTYNGNAVTASTIIPTKPVGFKTDITSIARTKLNLSSGGGFGGGFDENTDVNLSWSNPNSDYHFVVVDNIEANPVLIITLPTTSNFNDLTRRFRSQPVQGTTTQLRSQQFQYFGKHNLVLLKVNPDYAALYNSTGSTSQNISTPPTTITNGLGIFTGVNADTLAFTVKQK